MPSAPSGPRDITFQECRDTCTLTSTDNPFFIICLIVLSRNFQLSGGCHHTSYRAENLDPCLALTAFSSGSFFMGHTFCDTGPPFLIAYPKDPWLSLMNAVLLAKEQSLPILTSWVSRVLHKRTSESRPPRCFARALPPGYSNKVICSDILIVFNSRQCTCEE
jgi:hypothetical protein